MWRNIYTTILLFYGATLLAHAQAVQVIDFDSPARIAASNDSGIQLINFGRTSEPTLTAPKTSAPDPDTAATRSHITPDKAVQHGIIDVFSGMDQDTDRLAQKLIEAAGPLSAHPREAVRQTAWRFAGDPRLENASITPEDFAGLFEALISAESGFNQWVISDKGAIGMSQLMPGTADQLGVDPFSVEQNLYGGAEYLLQQIESFGDITLALAAYNAGPNAVTRYGGVPPFAETESYIARIKLNGADSLIETVQQRRLAVSRATPVPLMTGPLSPPLQPLIIHYKEG